MALINEIREQPEAAARFLDRQLASVERIGAAVARHDPAFVLVAGRGTSDHAAIYAQYALGIRNGLAVALASPSIVSLYGARPDLARALVIGISQSGASPDIVAVLEQSRGAGAPTIAITNDGGSALAGSADHVITLEAGPERSIAATKTYTTEVLAVAALSASLPGADRADRDALAGVSAAIEDALGGEAEARAAAGAVGEPDRAIVLGRGYEYGTAREWALKLQELAQVMAHPWSGADFEHGPLALLEPGVPVLAIVAADQAGDELARLLRRLGSEHGLQPIVVTGREEVPAAARLEAGRGLPSWLAPIASIVPGQLFAAELATRRGLDPDRPRAISKVTLTR